MTAATKHAGLTVACPRCHERVAVLVPLAARIQAEVPVASAPVLEPGRVPRPQRRPRRWGVLLVLLIAVVGGAVFLLRQAEVTIPGLSSDPVEEVRKLSFWRRTPAKQEASELLDR